LKNADFEGEARYPGAGETDRRAERRPHFRRSGIFSCGFVAAARTAPREINLVHDLDLPLDQVHDLRHLARRLTWFQHYFKKEAEEFGQKYNLAFAINDRRLAAAFLNWANVFERDRPDAALNRADFAVFSGGLMLRELLRANPVKAKEIGKVTECIPADPMAAICEFWPEGFLYTNCCLALVRAILKTDFNTNVALSPQIGELRFWESFRENVHEDVGRAVPFFDVFLGREPNWNGPEYFRSRPASRDAKRFLTTAPKSIENR